MNTNLLGQFEKIVNDDNGVMIADLSAVYSNGLHNISMVLNTVDSYQQNKDTVIAAFDEFLGDIQTVGASTQAFVEAQNSQADTSASSAADYDSSSVADSDSSSAASQTSSSSDQALSSAGGD